MRTPPALFALTALVAALVGCGGAPAPSAPPAVEIRPPASASGAVVASSAEPVDVSPRSQPKVDAPGPKVTALPSSSIRFEGGDGASKERPIRILGAKGEEDGVAAEYQYLDAVHGKGRWKPQGQALLEVDKKQLDKIDYVPESGQLQTIYFDISDYFGKF